MKQLRNILFIAILLIIGIASCGNDGEPVIPQNKGPIYSSKDSAAFCDFVKGLYGEQLDYMLYLSDMSLSDIRSWEECGMVKWRKFDNLDEYRIVKFSTANRLVYYQGNDDCNISPRIWDIDSLSEFVMQGYYIKGSVPPLEGKVRGLRRVAISSTGINSLPLSLFKRPRSIIVNIHHNPCLTTLPEGLETIPEVADMEKQMSSSYGYTEFDLRWNALSGKIPSDLNIIIDLSYNKYTDIDWYEWSKIDFASKFYYDPYNLHRPVIMKGPILWSNYLSGDVPNHILNDSLALIYTSLMVSHQIDGKLLPGLLDDSNALKMSDSYWANRSDLQLPTPKQ